MDDRIQLIEFLVSDSLPTWSKDQSFDDGMFLIIAYFISYRIKPSNFIL